MLVRLLSVSLLAVSSGCQIVSERSESVIRPSPRASNLPVSRADRSEGLATTPALLASWNQEYVPNDANPTGIETQIIQLPPVTDGESDHWIPNEGWRVRQSIISDHGNFYSRESLGLLAAGFGVGAAMANTSIDEKLHDKFQTNVRNARSDEWSRAAKELGNGRYTLPLFAAAWATGKIFDGYPVTDAAGEWGERSIRGILIGTPPLLVSQSATGASRPGEASSGSLWKPFQDNNGVSGHGFMGAIPFITAAKMTDNPLLKLALYGGSTLAPLSRVNDGAHYPSQAMLGWVLAYVAADAVDRMQSGSDTRTLLPILVDDSVGVGIEFRR